MCPLHYILPMDQLDSYSHTKYLTVSALAQSQYIVNKFPSKRGKIEEARFCYRKMIYWPGNCPCDKCEAYAVCADSGWECEAFGQFMKSGKWSPDDIELNLL